VSDAGRYPPVDPERLEAALGTLDPIMAQVFLHAAQGKEYGEIARMLNIPMPAVEQHLASALRQLFRALNAP
jgi:DNA-directed RNA polymerase specialized sigma24 family protein